jgi:hypothetical protein
MAVISNVWILRSLTTATPGALANGQLAYTANGDVLYIGSNGVVVPIGGKRNPGVLTANQALVANATGYLDVIKTANLTIGTVSVNTINTVANSTVLGAAANNELTSTWAIKTYVDAAVVAGGGSKNAGNGLSSNATSYFVLPGNSQIIANSTGTWIDQTQINHDALANYVANKHIDHTAVLISAGNGLAGGGDISATRTLSLNANNGLLANSSGAFVVAGTGVTVNSTGVHIGQAVATTSNPTFGTLTLTGNLIVSGSMVSINVATLAVTDSLIKLANGQTTADALDIGVYGSYGNSTVTKYAGLYRSAANGNFFLFKDLQAEPTTTVNATATGYATGILYADLVSSNVNFTGGSISAAVTQTIDCGTF